MSMVETEARTNGNAAPSHAEAKLPAIQGAAAFELLQRAAKALSLSSLVPEGYRNSLPNCMIALRIADRIGADPMMVMQNLDIVHGRPSWRAQFLIGTANSCGRFSAIRYEFFGERDKDSWGCRAWALEKATNEKLIGPDITIAIAKAEGWYQKNGSKWKSIPQLMLMYRAGSWWVRAYAPELSLGFHTAEEVGDIIDVTARTVDDDTLRRAASQLGAPKDEVLDADVTDVTDSVQTAIDAGDGVLAEEAAAEADEETPIERGRRLLKTITTAIDVASLHASISDELQELHPEQIKPWTEDCEKRRAELSGTRGRR